MHRLSSAAGRQDKGQVAALSEGKYQLCEVAQALTDNGHMLESRQVARVTLENNHHAGKRVCTGVREPLSAWSPHIACTAV